jgi:hypothetical protein
MRKGNGGVIGPYNQTTVSLVNGIFSLSEEQQLIGARKWIGAPDATAPNAPIITSVSSPKAGQANVSFQVGYDGGANVKSITVSSNPGNISNTVPNNTTTIVVSNLAAGNYTFSIVATNNVGVSGVNTSGPVAVAGLYSLLMHFDGSNGGTSFIDSTGQSTFSINAGSPTTSTTTYQFSPSSFKGATAGQATQISTSNKSIFAPGTGPFTIECWVYSTSQGGFQSWFSTRSTTGYAQAIFFGLSGGNVILYTSGALITSSMTLPTNTWTHVAISKPGGPGTTVYMYVNGAYAGQSGALTLDFSEQACSIGGTEYGGPGLYPFNGYVDELRMLNGIGVYSGTGSITVPTAPFVYPTI